MPCFGCPSAFLPKKTTTCWPVWKPWITAPYWPLSKARGSSICIAWRYRAAARWIFGLLTVSGRFNGGWYDFYGLDGGASIRMASEYSYDGRLEVGIGRTSVEKMTDGFLKYRLIRQRPHGWQQVSVTLLSSLYYTILHDPDQATNGFDKYANRSSRMSYAHQVIIGRKFSERFSLQIAPTLIHMNQVEHISDLNDAIVLAGAARFKITKRSAITVEYGWRAFGYTRTQYYDTFGVGWDIETGGHVFQMFLTNSQGLTEPQFLLRTSNKWSDAGIRLGFNISRAFKI